jgi:hypothetical protein
MGHVLLPAGHTEQDFRQAERIAVALKSDELVVCRLNATPRPAPRRPRPVPPSRPAATALSLLWGVVLALHDRRRARIPR